PREVLRFLNSAQFALQTGRGGFTSMRRSDYFSACEGSGSLGHGRPLFNGYVAGGSQQVSSVHGPGPTRAGKAAFSRSLIRALTIVAMLLLAAFAAAPAYAQDQGGNAPGASTPPGSSDQTPPASTPPADTTPTPPP